MCAAVRVCAWIFARRRCECFRFSVFRTRANVQAFSFVCFYCKSSRRFAIVLALRRASRDAFVFFFHRSVCTEWIRVSREIGAQFNLTHGQNVRSFLRVLRKTKRVQYIRTADCFDKRRPNRTEKNAKINRTRCRTNKSAHIDSMASLSAFNKIQNDKWISFKINNLMRLRVCAWKALGSPVNVPMYLCARTSPTPTSKNFH